MNSLSEASKQVSDGSTTSRESRGSLIAMRALVIGTLGFTAACGALDQYDRHKVEAKAPHHENTLRDASLYEDCTIDRVKAACDDMFQPSIALVDYTGMTEGDSRYLAGDTELTLEIETRGEIDASVVSIPASEMAKTALLATLRDRGEDPSCIDSSSLSNYPAYIAEEKMSELKKYDLVVGVVSQNNCDRPIGGIASNGLGPDGHRYSTVFEATRDSAGVVAHETSHSLGLAHSGKIWWRDSVSFDDVWDKHPEAVADIEKALEGSTYSPYSGSDTMGGPMPREIELGAMQMAALEEPRREFGEKTIVTEDDLSEAPATYTRDEIADSKDDILVTSMVKRPVQWRGKDEYSGEMCNKQFDQIGMVPRLITVDDRDYLSVGVYTHEAASGDIVDLGEIFIGNIAQLGDDEYIMRSMAFGNQKIVVRAANDKLTITQKK